MKKLAASSVKCEWNRVKDIIQARPKEVLGYRDVQVAKSGCLERLLN